MANLNKVMLIGRLTRDPEIRTFSNGGKVAKFGFAVNNRAKKGAEWVNEPVFLDCQAYNRGDYGKMADRVEQYLSKGKQVYLEGHLVFEQWTSQAGEKRNALRVVVDSMQFLDNRADFPEDGEKGSRSGQYKDPSAGESFEVEGDSFGEETGSRAAPRDEENLPF
ncbi:MAG: single-stranded DNA-binding protein [Gemmataceae bacterium]|nr:single-stranded DNA-binding protein [Gemmataceae bacterium]